MARWSRASRWLDLPTGAKVLDLGCAFGFGTRLLARKYETYGHDRDPVYIDRARRAVPQATFTVGRADSVPFPTDYFDGVVLLDVLEHVPDDRSVLTEIGRVLRPGGRLVLTLPNAGMLASIDSLNVYARWFSDDAAAPTDDPSWPESPHHRHYTVASLTEMLAPDFKVRRVGFTGLGFAEPINLFLLVLLRRLFPLPRAYRLLQYLYFGVYLLEDLLPAKSWGYHLTLLAERVGADATTHEGECQR